MAVSKPQKGKYALPILNCLTTALWLVSLFFTPVFLFIWIVALVSGRTNELAIVLGSPFHPTNIQGSLSLLYFVCSTLSILIAILRWLARNWIARFAESEQYLLTWKKVWRKRRIIIQSTGSVLLVVWAGGILDILYNAAGQILANSPKDASHASILEYIRGLFGPNPHLPQILVQWGILLFIAITLLVQLLAHLQPKEATIISVKELEPVYKTLDAASNHLQALSVDYTKHALEAINEQIIQGLAEKMLASLLQEIEQEKKDRALLADALEQEKNARSLLADTLEQERKARCLLADALEQEKQDRSLLKDSLEQEKKDRSLLESQVQQLLQQSDIASIPTAPPPQNQTKVTQKLNHFEEHDDSPVELIG